MYYPHCLICTVDHGINLSSLGIQLRVVWTQIGKYIQSVQQIFYFENLEMLLNNLINLVTQYKAAHLVSAS